MALPKLHNPQSKLGRRAKLPYGYGTFGNNSEPLGKANHMLVAHTPARNVVIVELVRLCAAFPFLKQIGSPPFSQMSYALPLLDAENPDWIVWLFLRISYNEYITFLVAQEV
jgi:hypothetical protein